MGFAWDLTGSRKTVIRGGAGLFYADIQVNQTIDDQIFNGQTTISPAIQGTAANPINLLAPWGGVTGDQFLSGAVPVNAQTIQPLGPNVQTPYSLQMSIGIARQLNRSWTLSADYIHWRVYHDWLRTDANLFYNPATGYTANPSTAGRPNPSFVGILNFTTPAAAGSLYDGMHVGVTHRFSQSFSVVGRLHARAPEGFDDRSVLLSEQPVQPGGRVGGFAGQSDSYTLTIAGSYAWKWGIALSGSFHFGSGQNFQVTANQNPFGATGVTDRLFLATSPYYGSPSNVKASTVPGYNIVARDSLVGHQIKRVDLRLSKTFTVKDRVRFIPMVEAFNLFNHSNFGTYQTVVNVAQYGLPAQNADLAYAARMLQFAGRIEF